MTHPAEKDAGRFTSSDGLMSSSDPTAVALWEGITARAEFAKMSWTDILRARGVKYAHPDDGWVNRDLGEHTRSWYPQFDDRPEIAAEIRAEQVCSCIEEWPDDSRRWHAHCRGAELAARIVESHA